MAAINDGFPEGVWLSGLFLFLLDGRYLTVVFQGDDDLLLAKVRMNGTRSSNTATKWRVQRYPVTAAEATHRVRGGHGA